jgi:hypothetical protein
MPRNTPAASFVGKFFPRVRSSGAESDMEIEVGVELEERNVCRYLRILVSFLECS